MSHRVASIMKSIIYSETGDTSVLRLVDREIAVPRPGEVRVRVVISGVNPTDWKSRRGTYSGEALPETGIIPNQDGAGIIDAVGPGVTGISVGDRVWITLAAYQRTSGGTAQEYTVLPAVRVHPLPESASFELGASLGVPAVTAHRALTVSENGPSRLSVGALKGKVVLVAGGAGAVGHAAIQLAHWAGATVITTVSSAQKAALASAAGAHHVVNYKESDAATEVRRAAPHGVDIVVEVSPAQNAALNLAVAANHATIAVYANNGGDVMSLDVRKHFSLNLRYQFLLLYTVGDAALNAAIAAITAAVRDGAMEVGEQTGLPLHRFDLAHTADAHAAVESGAVGKVLIDIVG